MYTLDQKLFATSAQNKSCIQDDEREVFIETRDQRLCGVFRWCSICCYRWKITGMVYLGLVFNGFDDLSSLPACTQLHLFAWESQGRSVTIWFTYHTKEMCKLYFDFTLSRGNNVIFKKTQIRKKLARRVLFSCNKLAEDIIGSILY